jgi:hypothetical protein
MEDSFSNHKRVVYGSLAVSAITGKVLGQNACAQFLQAIADRHS